MADGMTPETAAPDDHKCSTNRCQTPPLTCGNTPGERTKASLSATRLAWYIVVAFWAGNESQANWSAFLRSDWNAAWTTGALTLACIVALALMWRHDRALGRVGSEGS